MARHSRSSCRRNHCRTSKCGHAVARLSPCRRMMLVAEAAQCSVLAAAAPAVEEPLPPAVAVQAPARVPAARNRTGSCKRATAGDTTRVGVEVQWRGATCDEREKRRQYTLMRLD